MGLKMETKSIAWSNDGKGAVLLTWINFSSSMDK